MISINLHLTILNVPRLNAPCWGHFVSVYEEFYVAMVIMYLQLDSKTMKEQEEIETERRGSAFVYKVNFSFVSDFIMI